MRKFLAKVLGITHEHVEIPQDRLNVHTIKKFNLEPINVRSEHRISLDEFKGFDNKIINSIQIDIRNKAAIDLFNEMLTNGLVKTIVVDDEMNRVRKIQYQVQAIKQEYEKIRGL